MVERAELFGIADEILAEGRQPSQRAIRDRLAKGGSFGDIGPLFVEWATLRGYRPRPRAEDLPSHLRDRLANVAAEIWHDGLRNGMVAAQNERDRLGAENAALKLALAEMTVLAEPPGRADLRGDQPTKASEKVDERIEDVPRRRKDSIAFWDRVMKEVLDLMGDRLFEPKEIFRLLDEGTAREAPKWTDKKWGPSFLADKMRGRAKEGKFFDEPKPGYFRSRSAAAKANLSTEGSAALAMPLAGATSMPAMVTPVPRVAATATRASASSLRRLPSIPGEPLDADDMPGEIVFSTSACSADELDARDAYLAGE